MPSTIAMVARQVKSGLKIGIWYQFNPLVVATARAVKSGGASGTFRFLRGKYVADTNYGSVFRGYPLNEPSPAEEEYYFTVRLDEEEGITAFLDPNQQPG